MSKIRRAFFFESLQAKRQHHQNINPNNRTYQIGFTRSYRRQTMRENVGNLHVLKLITGLILQWVPVIISTRFRFSSKRFLAAALSNFRDTTQRWRSRIRHFCRKTDTRCLVPVGVELCSEDNDVGIGCGVLTDDALTAIVNQHILTGYQAICICKELTNREGEKF